ncbi:MAG: YggS family pyridoxal phosphate-dependent enzyme [Flavobacteriales bacterium CG_4_8_14_3_um_filter_35_10]|nr:MAG: YggS family pyridoxal phosphate-dependent enzyme [Flavobacteriales bacterium CG_4_8_14_3_um_filter_35_10]
MEFFDIATKLNQIKKALPPQVTLVAVSKTKSEAAILEAYNAGQRVFGENKIQEMAQKHTALPKDIQWHMIGHLQRNKVKYMAHFVDLIHGVDSLQTLIEINRQAEKHHRVINCLLQAHIAQEETKFGLSLDEIEQLLNSAEIKNLKNISVVGIMGMASFTDDLKQIEAEFKSLNTFFNQLKSQNKALKVLSMGMSGDYQLAIKCGSNMVRVGSAIFGERNYV